MLTAVGSWLDTRAAGGQWLLRVEDIDPPREQAGAADSILRTLDTFSLYWDEAVVYQSLRSEAFHEAVQHLMRTGWAYPCRCSRKQLTAAGNSRGQAGETVYPGLCRHLTGISAGPHVIRVRTTGQITGMKDRIQGFFGQRLKDDVGDFVIRRRDGYTAYQLAVVIDDAAQQITDVVRGIDLLDSTPRQQWLQQLLGLPEPRYMHLPIVVNPSGRKLSKQTGAMAIERQPAGALAWWALECLGLHPPKEMHGAPPEEQWTWGVAHWETQQLRGVRSISLPDTFSCTAK